MVLGTCTYHSTDDRTTPDGTTNHIPNKSAQFTTVKSTE
jgi:hypothetical protein